VTALATPAIGSPSLACSVVTTLRALRRCSGSTAGCCWSRTSGDGALEALVEEQLAYAHLRGVHVGARARAAFDADRGGGTTWSWSRFPPSPSPLRSRCVTSSAPAAICWRQRRALAPRTAAPAAARSVVFEALPRHAIATLDAPLASGDAVAARLHGAGPYVACVRGITPARWDEATRELVEQALFEDWLRERRARAHIEWNWGATPENSPQ
jgi:hypothetical protein